MQLVAFFSESGVIWKDLLPEVIILLKIGDLKRRSVPLAGQQRKNEVSQQLQTKTFWKVSRFS